MLQDPLSINKAIDVLNRFTAADPVAMRLLIETRIQCSEELAKDPTCQVASGKTGPMVGLLGILNGLFGSYEDGDHRGWGPLSAVFSDDEQTLIGFRQTVIPGLKVVSDLPPLVKDQFDAFLRGREPDKYTICENDIGWYLYPLGLEARVEPLLAVAKDQ